MVRGQYPEPEVLAPTSGWGICRKAALLGLEEEPRPRSTTIRPGSIVALIASYMKSEAYTSLREGTKIGYASRRVGARQAIAKLEAHTRNANAQTTRTRLDQNT
jgi:hypothetical protein